MTRKIAQNPRPQNSRLWALAAIADVLDSNLNLTDSPALKDQEKGRDLSQARHLAYGVLRWLTALDYLARQMLSKPLKPRDRDVYRLILLGLYQLWQDATAPHAAIHETAECARKLQKPWAVGLINAVLRRFQRERETRLDELGTVEERFAHPSWILEKMQADWPEHWQTIVNANNQQAPLFLRINRSSPASGDVITRLAQQEFRVSAHPIAADAIRIMPAANLDSISGFSQGQLSVQDPAAQLAVDLLDLRPGIRVLDACAAPGGKTCHILEREPTARVLAIDQNKNRIGLINENLGRLKLNCEVQAADAAKPDQWWDGTHFQRILLDAPCSATGVIRRHPEIKHLRTAGQVDAATRLQEELLNQLWPLLELGGILVYATCSVFKDENSRQISHFLKQQEDAEETPVAASWGITQSHGRQILPGEQDMDGFYYAVLHKKT